MKGDEREEGEDGVTEREEGEDVKVCVRGCGRLIRHT